VAKVARRLRYRRSPIIILPTGTANNIARSLGLMEMRPVADYLVGSLRKLNIGRARGPWGNLSFVESVGVGAIAGAIAESEERPPKPFRIATGPMISVSSSRTQSPTTSRSLLIVRRLSVSSCLWKCLI
jgi:diacylglycerol kinase family enzyme